MMIEMSFAKVQCSISFCLKYNFKMASYKWVMWCDNSPVLFSALSASKYGHTNTQIPTQYSIQNFELGPMAMICKIDSGATKRVLIYTPQHTHCSSNNKFCVTKLPVHNLFYPIHGTHTNMYIVLYIHKYRIFNKRFVSFLFYFKKKSIEARVHRVESSDINRNEQCC